MDLIVPFGLIAGIAAVLVLVLDWFWPRVPAIRLEIVASVPVPLILAGMMALALARPPAEDFEGMVVASLLAAGPIILLLTFGAGLPGAMAALWLRRFGRAP